MGTNIFPMRYRTTYLIHEKFPKPTPNTFLGISWRIIFFVVNDIGVEVGFGLLSNPYDRYISRTGDLPQPV